MSVSAAAPSGSAVPDEPKVNAQGEITWQGRTWRLLSEGQSIIDPELVSHAIRRLMSGTVATQLAGRIKPPTSGSPAEPAFSVHFAPNGTVSVLGPKAAVPSASPAATTAVPLPSPSAAPPELVLDPTAKTALGEIVRGLTNERSGPIARARNEARVLYRDLCTAGHNPKSIQHAIDHILSEGALFVSEEAGHEDEACYERTLCQCLLERENRPLLEALHEARSMARDAVSKADESHWLERLRGIPAQKVVGAEQAIRHFLLPRLFREPKAVGTEVEGRFVQHFAKPQPGSRAQPCLDPASDSDISHLGVVIHEGRGVAAIRSGPANSPEKVEQLIQFALEREAAQPESQRRIREEGGGFHFQHHITSLFDPSQTGKAVKRTEKNEEAYLRSLLQGCDALRTGSPKKVKVRIDGTEKEVVLDPPIVSQELFSSSPVGEAIKKRMNQLATLRMLEQGELPVSEEVKKQIGEARAAFQKKFATECATWSLDKWAFGEGGEQAIQASTEFTTYMQAIEAALKFGISETDEDPEARLFAKAFLVQLTGRDEEGNSLDAMDQEIYRNLLTEHLGLSSSKQDRDGLEKTGVAVALQEAQARFRARSTGAVPHGGLALAPTGPLPPPMADRGDFRPDMGDADRKEFRHFFREALLRHGVDVFAEATGYSGTRLFGSAERFGATKMASIQRYLGDDGLASRLAEREGAARRARSMSLWKEKMPEGERKDVVAATEQLLRGCLTSTPLPPPASQPLLPFVFSHDNLTIAQVADNTILDPAKIRGKLATLKQEITAAYASGGLKGHSPFSRMGFFKRLFKTDPMTQPEVRKKYFQAVLLEQVLHAHERSVAAREPSPEPSAPPPLPPPPIHAPPPLPRAPSPPPHPPSLPLTPPGSPKG